MRQSLVVTVKGTIPLLLSVVKAWGLQMPVCVCLIEAYNASYGNCGSGPSYFQDAGSRTAITYWQGQRDEHDGIVIGYAARARAVRRKQYDCK
jgi:hypothetical protein